MKKRTLCLLLSLCLLCGLSGCTRVGREEDQSVSTLPPATVSFDAPDGDEVIGEPQYRVLYLPDSNELHLIPRMARTEAGELGDIVESLVEKQIEAENQLQAEKVEMGEAERRPLTTGGDRSVEISSGICTVNLGSSALQMPLSDYYKFCIVLTTTLCELDPISFVNVLVADQSVGLDITGSLAMGSLTAHPNENLPVLWEQMEARRTPLGEALSETSLNALATLYYPLAEGQGIACENRILTFEGQTPQQLAVGLLSELDRVNRDRGDLSIQALMLHDPLTSELEDGGRLITMSFRENLAEELEKTGTDMACMLAAVTYTLTTFIPGIAAICVRIGDKPITELNSDRFGSISVLGGLLRREMFRDFLMDSATVYLHRNGKLYPCEHYLAWRYRDRPREQLLSLMEGPTEEERELGIAATLPSGLQEEDILGIAAEDGTLLVNLSGEFREAIREAGPEAEMMLCYSMVNTLCDNSGMRKVCFFFEGEQVETIAGSLYWAGTFLYNPALNEDRLG